ncbi:WecB/TagA/CpsF family glycosyltransferase [Prolixibacter sp. NT017]|uniref:WecB/TagA/CpsF family glycosyltransferase n=1 Tax=Prolixibacter sp. NT017 TaxID=2652390 RepID=UPI001280F583|nr:WecB/TagA/CpsF family glycosyltransferase [Prolixibacter sp. NT017]GET24465.1 beta-1,4-N-acetyl- mannosaminyltransferase [Prolixibacter sp. NT017]
MKLSTTDLYHQSLNDLTTGKLLITTINAHSYNVAQQDPDFVEALQRSDVLLPDGVSVAWAKRWLTGQPVKKIAGADLFAWEMNRLAAAGQGKVFFLGSTEKTLAKIKARAAREYPKVEVHTYSPPYKPEFTEEDNSAMLAAVNAVQPDVLFIGMTAPKQEKWAYRHKEQLQAGHIGCIGAVFDFYAGTVNRAPQWMLNLGLEWFYRLIREPRRMWRRYLIGNTKFILSIMKEKVQISKHKEERR